MTKVLDIAVGPLLMRIELTQDQVGFIGDYSVLAPDGQRRPDVHIQAELSEEFTNGRVPSAMFPAFEIPKKSDGRLHLSRFDAEGSIDLSDPGTISASFEGSSSASSLEAMIRAVASIALPRHNTLILHSSAVEDEQGAHVFSGQSGAGKSTIARMLSETFPLRRLSDELLLLRKMEQQWYVEVAPFSGKVTLPARVIRPLQSINFLVQAPVHEREVCRPNKTMQELPKHILSYAGDPTSFSLILELAADIAEHIPCYVLQFAKNPEVAKTLKLSYSSGEPTSNAAGVRNCPI